MILLNFRRLMNTVLRSACGKMTLSALIETAPNKTELKLLLLDETIGFPKFLSSISKDDTSIFLDVGALVSGYLLNILPSAWGLLTCDEKSLKVEVLQLENEEYQIIYNPPIIYQDNSLNKTEIGELSIIVRITSDKKIVFEQFNVALDDEKMEKAIKESSLPKGTEVSFDKDQLLNALREQEEIINTLSYSILINTCKQLTSSKERPTNKQVEEFDSLLKKYDLNIAPAWVAQYVRLVSDYLHGRLFALDLEAIEQEKKELLEKTKGEKAPVKIAEHWVGHYGETSYVMRDAAVRFLGMLQPNAMQCALDARRDLYDAANPAHAKKLLPAGLTGESLCSAYVNKIDEWDLSSALGDYLKNRFQQGSLMGFTAHHMSLIFSEYDLWNEAFDICSFTGTYNFHAPRNFSYLICNEDGSVTFGTKNTYPRKDKNENMSSPTLDAKYRIYEENGRVQVLVEQYEASILGDEFVSSYLKKLRELIFKKIRNQESLLLNEKQAYYLMIVRYLEPSINGMVLRGDTIRDATASDLLLLACFSESFLIKILSDEALVNKLSTDDLILISKVENNSTVWKHYRGRYTLFVDTFVAIANLAETGKVQQAFNQNKKLFENLKSKANEYLMSGLLPVQVAIFPMIRQWWNLIQAFKGYENALANDQDFCRTLKSISNDFVTMLLKAVDMGFITSFDALTLENLDVETASRVVSFVIQKNIPSEVDSIFYGGSLIDKPISENLRKVFQVHPGYVFELLNSRAAVAQLSMLRKVDEATSYLVKGLIGSPDFLKSTWPETRKNLENIVKQGKQGSTTVMQLLAVADEFSERENPEFYQRLWANMVEFSRYDNTCQMHQPRLLVDFLKQNPQFILKYLLPGYISSLSANYQFTDSRMWLDAEDVVALLLVIEPKNSLKAFFTKPTFFRNLAKQINYRALFLGRPGTFVDLFMHLEPNVFEENVIIDEMLRQAFIEAFIYRFARDSNFSKKANERLTNNTMLLDSIKHVERIHDPKLSDSLMIYKLDSITRMIQSFYPEFELVDLLIGTVKNNKPVGSQPFGGRYTPIAYLISKRFSSNDFNMALEDPLHTLEEKKSLADVIVKMITNHQLDSILTDLENKDKCVLLMRFINLYGDESLCKGLAIYLERYNQASFENKNTSLTEFITKLGFAPTSPENEASSSANRPGFFATVQLATFASRSDAVDTRAVKQAESPVKNKK